MVIRLSNFQGLNKITIVNIGLLASNDVA